MFLALVGKLRDENDKPVTRKRWDFRVVASIHNAPAYADRLKQTLNGLHRAIINGEETEINIVVLDVFNEGDVQVFGVCGSGSCGERRSSESGMARSASAVVRGAG